MLSALVVSTSMTQPVAADARAIAREAFAFEQVSVSLDLASAPTDSPLLMSLLRDGILYPIAHRTDACGERQVALALTARGRRLAGAYGWLIRSQVLTIPVGVVKAETTHARLTTTAGARAIDVLARLQPNGNFRLLMRLAPPTEWKFLSDRWLVSFNADDASREIVISLPIVYVPSVGWEPAPVLRPTSGC